MSLPTDANPTNGGGEVFLAFVLGFWLCLLEFVFGIRFSVVGVRFYVVGVGGFDWFGFGHRGLCLSLQPRLYPSSSSPLAQFI